MNLGLQEKKKKKRRERKFDRQGREGAAGGAERWGRSPFHQFLLFLPSLPLENGLESDGIGKY